MRAKKFTVSLYVFQYKDHLGNVRLSYSDKNLDGAINPVDEIVEESNYYPFGLQHKGYNNTVTGGNSLAQAFKYNGVELNESLGVNLYEMAFRSYDPAIGRFNGIDPVTHHSQGTSVAFDNNPVFWADPSGANSGRDGSLSPDDKSPTGDDVYFGNAIASVTGGDSSSDSSSSPPTDYGVSKDGRVTQIGPTNNSPDKLYSTDDNGDVNTDVKPVTVSDKNLLPQLACETNCAEAKENDTNLISGPVANTSSQRDAYNVFKFGAGNSNAEWSFQNYTDGSNAIATAYYNSSTIQGYHHFSNFGKTVNIDIHSHPDATKSDFRASGTDIFIANSLLKRNPNVRVMLYMPKQTNPNARMYNMTNNTWITNY